MDYVGLAIGMLLGVVAVVIIAKLLGGRIFLGKGIDVDRLDERVKDLEGTNIDLNRQRTRLEAQLESVQNQLTQHIETISDLRSSQAEANKNLATAQAQVKNLELLHNNLIAEKKSLTEQNSDLIEEKTKLISRVSALTEINKKLEEAQKEFNKLENRFQTEFENISNRLIKQNAETINVRSTESLEKILNPLKENINTFKKSIEDKYVKEVESRASLKTELENLINLNKQLSQEANNLTKALTGNNKQQGNWGEVVLERVLERSGLHKGSEYKLQEHFNTEEGKKIPDAVVYLPDNKHIIIDSKVSLTAYQRSVDTPNDEQSAILQEHVNSLKNHIRQLSDKTYYSITELNSPDFTLLFIPIEASFSAALRKDPLLFNFAWERKIILVSPTTLLATLRTIESTWKQERQTRNALEIARVGGRLYDKFVGFVNDMKKIKKGLKNSTEAYNNAMNKLSDGSGNLVRTAENLKTLGAKAKKSLPSELVEESIEFIESSTDE